MADLSGFLVVPAKAPGGERDVIRLVCTRCPPRDAVVSESEPPDGAQYEGPAVSDLVAAANRHTWKAHRHPRL